MGFVINGVWVNGVFVCLLDQRGFFNCLCLLQAI